MKASYGKKNRKHLRLKPGIPKIPQVLKQRIPNLYRKKNNSNIVIIGDYEHLNPIMSQTTSRVWFCFVLMPAH